MRVALVHDWLTGMRGGERVLHELALRHPDADLHTLVHVPGSTSPEIDALRIHTSPLQHLPAIDRHYRKTLPLYPWAIDRFALEGYDLVLSTSHAVAKSVHIPDGTVHVSYCFTPMRYVWDQRDVYLGRGPMRLASWPLAAALRHFDRRRSDERHVTRFVAISRGVADRIRRAYGREASVVHPPVDTERFTPSGRDPEDYYLLVGGFVAYKREDLVLDAFRRLDRPLVVVGDGPGLRSLRRKAPPCVRFTGRIDDADLATLYAGARALVYPQEEDFGLVAVEAQAAGRPVIALARGGALDTIRPLRTVGGSHSSAPRREGATGLFFERQHVDDLVTAVRAFESECHLFETKTIRGHAEGFGRERFHHELQREIDLAMRAGGAASVAGDARRS